MSVLDRSAERLRASEVEAPSPGVAGPPAALVAGARRAAVDELALVQTGEPPFTLESVATWLDRLPADP